MERGGLAQDVVALLNVLGVLVVDVDNKAAGVELNVDLLAGDTGDMGLNDVAVGVLLNVHLEGVGSLGIALLEVSEIVDGVEPVVQSVHATIRKNSSHDEQPPFVRGFGPAWFYC